MNIGTAAQMAFVRYAKSKGYIQKVVGDDAYSKFRTPASQQKAIRLISARNDSIQVVEEGKMITMTLASMGFRKVGEEYEYKGI